MNADKTFHVSYAKTDLPEPTYYYINTKRIRQVEKIKDLGVIFDNRLKFKHHIAEVNTKLFALTGLGNRLAREIHSKYIMMEILRTYIIPVVEYASNIWGIESLTESVKFERALHIITRRTLGTP